MKFLRCKETVFCVCECFCGYVGIYAPVIFLLLPQWALADSTLNQTAPQCRANLRSFSSIPLSCALSALSSLSLLIPVTYHHPLFATTCHPLFFSFISSWFCFTVCLFFNLLHSLSLPFQSSFIPPYLTLLCSSNLPMTNYCWHNACSAAAYTQTHTHTHIEDERMCSRCAEKLKGTSGWVLVQTVCDRAMQIC